MRKVRINDSHRIVLGLFLMASVLFMTVLPALAQEYPALKGVKTAKAVFDVRMGDPKMVALHLKLINQTFQDLTTEKKSPDFVLVFLGPSVKLFSTDRKDFNAEDQKTLDEIAAPSHSSPKKA